jgi:hypothetical protein
MCNSPKTARASGNHLIHTESALHGTPCVDAALSGDDPLPDVVPFLVKPC